MASSSLPAASSFNSLPAASSFNSKCKYDVFLSFRGEDTRKSFTGHLYTALDQKGIFTFKDDEKLERGTEISSELLLAIEESMFSIIILSKNYASSSWCLDELVKIVDCINKKQHMAFPIFYDVDRSDVRNQMGDFKEAFDKHEEENKEKVERWRSALKQVANLAGWHLQDKDESELIKEIVDNISRKLDVAFPTSIAKDFIGMEYRVDELKPYIKPLSNNVRFIGMWGMGGIGKTTLARVVYDWLKDQYQGCCFLANVREICEASQTKGLISLQEQLLSNVLKGNKVKIRNVHNGVQDISRRLRLKKVLLVLDDVDKKEQLEKLAKVPDWFGYGSRIIITTRDKHLLTSHGVQYIYEVKRLNHGDAIKLLHFKAFNNKQPENDHHKLSSYVVSYAQGLPLALEVLGSFLCNRSVDEWKSTLDRLEKYPEEGILKVLRISYDGLKWTEQQIFLDIACFFKGQDKDRVMEILDSCQFYPAIGVTVLIEKSLIAITADNKIWMHDMLQVMGWDIVRKEHPRMPSEWSRLWMANDIYRVLQENRGTDAIEGIILDKPKEGVSCLNGESLSKMSNLRFLQISNFQLSGDIHLSNQLRILDWSGYPSKSLPLDFELKDLLELKLCNSHTEYLWEGEKSFEKLKTIDLSHSCKLIRTPNFKKVPNLERLILDGCRSLLEVHQSVGALTRLIVLNLKNCKSLVNFPSSICGLKSLKILILYGCSSLDKLPEDLGDVESLEELDVSWTAIRQVPSSIVWPGNLETLCFRGCKEQSTHMIFPCLPYPQQLLLPSLQDLFSLKTLDLCDCNLSEEVFPSGIGSLSSLEKLNLSRNSFLSLPESIKELSKLKNLCLESCPRLQSLPELPPNITLLEADNCTSLDLETLSRALRNCTSTHITMHFFNGRKLVKVQGKGDSLEVRLLNSWLEQDLSDQASQFHIRLPRSEIPDYFTCWRNGSAIEILLPSKALNEVKGFVVCIVFEAPAYVAKNPIVIRCSLRLSTKEIPFMFKVPKFTAIGSSHISLSYLSKRLFETSDSDMEDYVKASFSTSYPSIVKKCGIRPVCKQDDFEVLPGPMDQVSSIPSMFRIRKVKRQPVALGRGDVKAQIFSDIISFIKCCLLCD